VVVEEGVEVEGLKAGLRQRLADYMVPGQIVKLAALPLSANGKVDRNALPLPDLAHLSGQKEFASARTPAEQLLTTIFTQVLGIPQISIHDNFFEVGGDSIIGIHAMARANQAGLRLTAAQLFQHQTIAELASLAEETEGIQAEQGLVTSEVPLTPIQHWFFEQRLANPHHWNQAFLMELKHPLQPPLLQECVEQVLLHHDALRIRFTQTESGWQQSNQGHIDSIPFSTHDLSSVAEAEREAALETIAAQLQASLDLSAGPLIRVALFQMGATHPGYLLIIVHHLVVDGLSWWIILEDLQNAFQQLSSGAAVRLPIKTTSFKQWAEKLKHYAETQIGDREATYWLSEERTQAHPLPKDFADGLNIEASAQTVSVILTAEETRALTQEVPKAYNTQINDALLTALALGFSAWSGTDSLLVQTELHGREELIKGVDISRTVGWFTSMFPLCLRVEPNLAPRDALKLIKEQIRQVPNHGIGYGLLRYLSGKPELAERLRQMPQPEISFNFLGQLDQLFMNSPLFTIARPLTGPHFAQQGSRISLIYILGNILRGQLQMSFSYSENIHRRATIERLAQEFLRALRSLIGDCLSPDAGGYTPSDFPQARLNQKQLDNLISKIVRADRGKTL
jgi:non-ribosomal peptide synthase protein (TIGR01720 family)